jgi:signal transduction histidine kinase
MTGQARALAADRMSEMRRVIRELKPLEEELTRQLRGLDILPDTAAFHERMADLLQARGEPVAALGHRRRSQTSNKSLNEE